VSGTTQLQLPRLAGAAGLARLVVTAHGTGLSEERLKSARLLVSELVTNAFQHGDGQIELQVRSDDDGVWAEVCDEGRGPVARAEPRPPRGGWGLNFVDQLADDWGADASHVWFRVGGRNFASAPGITPA
jgi:anti-sigma regulatory factor (Ser/Thr protein kinase)